MISMDLREARASKGPYHIRLRLPDNLGFTNLRFYYWRTTLIGRVECVQVKKSRIRIFLHKLQEGSGKYVRHRKCKEGVIPRARIGKLGVIPAAGLDHAEGSACSPRPLHNSTAKLSYSLPKKKIKYAQATAILKYGHIISCSGRATC
jgi:hypothetical protein